MLIPPTEQAKPARSISMTWQSCATNNEVKTLQIVDTKISFGFYFYLLPFFEKQHPFSNHAGR